MTSVYHWTYTGSSYMELTGDDNRSTITGKCCPNIWVPTTECTSQGFQIRRGLQSACEIVNGHCGDGFIILFCQWFDWQCCYKLMKSLHLIGREQICLCRKATDLTRWFMNAPQNYISVSEMIFLSWAKCKIFNSNDFFHISLNTWYNPATFHLRNLYDAFAVDY